MSGIGQRTEGGKYIVPIDETKDWNTMGDDYIELRGSANASENAEDKGLQPTAFIFHEICWALLMEQCGPRVGSDPGPSPSLLDLDRLFTMCSIMPRANCDDGSWLLPYFAFTSSHSHKGCGWFLCADSLSYDYPA
jgi:hypothetical protein